MTFHLNKRWNLLSGSGIFTSQGIVISYLYVHNRRGTISHYTLTCEDVVLGKKNFKCRHCNFAFISSLKRAWSFVLTNLTSLHLRMLCAKVGLNRCNGSAEKKIFKCRQCISYFAIISHLKKAWPFIWTNLNPHLPRIFWAKLFEIGPAVLKKKILLNVDLLFSI